MVQDDIVYHILKFARDNHGVFKASSFYFIADPPRTWYEKDKLLKNLVERGYFERYKGEGCRVYTYRLTLKGRSVLEL